MTVSVPESTADEFGYHHFTCPMCNKEKYGDKHKHIELCSRIPVPVSMDAVAFANAQKSLIDAAVAQSIAKMELEFKSRSNPSNDPEIEAAIQKLVEDGLSRFLAAAIVSEKGPDYIIPGQANSL